MTNHPVQWQAPQPLWSRFGAAGASAATTADQARPAILRFATDDFMDEMLGTLERDPSRLDRLIARPESWRTPMTDHAELIERTPVPLIAQSALRRTFALKPRATIDAVVREKNVEEQGQTRRLPLKLYQPAHQRFYLVGASLVCGIPGLPDRAIVSGGGEQINFVIRRLLPVTPGSTTGELLEHAFVPGANDAHWRRIGDGTASDQVAPGEELLPALPLNYHDDTTRPRTLWSGFVPVGRREEYMGVRIDRSAAKPLAEGQRDSLRVEDPGPKPSLLARMAQFQTEVAEPWKTMLRSAFKFQKDLAEAQPEGVSGSEKTADRRTRIFDFNLQQQNVSWLVLLDFSDYLTAHLADLWTVIDNSGAGYSALSKPRKDVYDWLGSASMSSTLRAVLPTVNAPSPTLRDALKAIRAPGVRAKLEQTELSYLSGTLTQPDWPPFQFVLAGVNSLSVMDGPFKALTSLAVASDDEVQPDPIRPLIKSPPEAAQVDRLITLVTRALVLEVETKAPPIPFAMQVRNALTDNVRDEGWFVARFVYTNRDCGPLHPPRLSEPTQRFQLANFFDPDAPARPIRITLPTDTSPAGLRKYQKNTAFVVSDMLCGQIQRAKGLGLIDLVLSILPWPFHKDLDLGDGSSCNNGKVNIGMICSISIPIITICALILLIIIVTLLDLVFRWLPFFIFCFPVPNLAGKKATT